MNTNRYQSCLFKRSIFIASVSSPKCLPPLGLMEGSRLPLIAVIALLGCAIEFYYYQHHPHLQGNCQLVDFVRGMQSAGYSRCLVQRCRHRLFGASSGSGSRLVELLPHSRQGFSPSMDSSPTKISSLERNHCVAFRLQAFSKPQTAANTCGKLARMPVGSVPPPESLKPPESS